MGKQIVLLIASAMMLVAIAKIGAIDPNRPHSEHDYEHGNKQKYTCVMHPEVVIDHPGNCPTCGMKLIPKKEESKTKPKSNPHESHDMQQHHGDEVMPHESHQMH